MKRRLPGGLTRSGGRDPLPIARPFARPERVVSATQPSLCSIFAGGAFPASRVGGLWRGNRQVPSADGLAGSGAITDSI